VGRVIQVNRQSVTVVGVMPPSFQGLMPGRAVDIFVPMSMVPATAPPYYSLAPDYWWVQIFARLRPGASEETATAAVEATLAHHIESYAGTAAPSSNLVKIVLEPGTRGVGLLRRSIHTMYILAAVSGLVLLIACLNLANLLLARHAARNREIAVRVSIGASRWRLIRQMLTESLLLASMGAAAGLLLAVPMTRLLLGFLAGTTPLGLDAHLDARVLGFTLAVALLTAMLFGAAPAWRATRAGSVSGLKSTPSIAAGRGPRFLVGRYLVSLQIALSLLLVVGTGLFLRTLMNLAAVDLGFQADRILTFQTDPEKTGYKPAQAGEIYRRLEERIAAIPGVEAVGMSHLPLIGGVTTNGRVRLPGDSKGNLTWFLDCSDSFLSVAKIPILVGRDFNRADFDRPVPSAIVNETFVKRYLPGVSPIGRISYPPGWGAKDKASEPFTIVGVVRDAHYRGVRDAVPPTAYVPYAYRAPGDSRMVFMIRARIAPMSLVSAVRQAVAAVDANLPVAEMRTEREQIDRSLGSERMFATLVTMFGAIALVLAAIGIYGVMAFSVARRTPEIGIRMAIGAQRGDVQWLVLRQSLSLAALGVFVGIPSALELTSLVSKLLYGVKPNDPISLIGAVMVMIAVAGLAAWIPARRASRIDPMVALRNE
jgi:predicted permease